MKINKECSLVQNLLNDYINDNVSDDAKQAVQEHLEECTDCKNLLNQMIEDEKNNTQDQAQKIKSKEYLKKFNRKYSRIKAIVSSFFILVAIVAILLMANFIYENLLIRRTRQAIWDLAKEDNLYISIRRQSTTNSSYDSGLSNWYANSLTEYYIKGKKIKDLEYAIIDGNKVLRSETYETIGEDSYTIDRNNKTYQMRTLMVYTDDFGALIENALMFEMYRKDNIKIGELNRLKIGDEKFYNFINVGPQNSNSYSSVAWIAMINKSTDLPVKVITSNTNKTGSFSYMEYSFLIKKDVVTDKDVDLPDLSDYTNN